MASANKTSITTPVAFEQYCTQIRRALDGVAISCLQFLESQEAKANAAGPTDSKVDAASIESMKARLSEFDTLCDHLSEVVGRSKERLIRQEVLAEVASSMGANRAGPAAGAPNVRGCSITDVSMLVTLVDANIKSAEDMSRAVQEFTASLQSINAQDPPDPLPEGEGAALGLGGGMDQWLHDSDSMADGFLADTSTDQARPAVTDSA